MSERRPPSSEHYSDADRIDLSIHFASVLELPISDPAARVISSQIHEGQASPTYSLTSTGAIREDLLPELEHTLAEAEAAEDNQLRTWVIALMQYVESRAENTEPVDGWSSMWLGVRPGESVDG